MRLTLVYWILYPVGQVQANVNALLTVEIEETNPKLQRQGELLPSA